MDNGQLQEGSESQAAGQSMHALRPGEGASAGSEGVPAAAEAREPSIRAVFAALILVLLLAALDQTIVSTALPTIVAAK